MTNSGLATQKTRLTLEQGDVSRETVLKLFGLIAAVSLLLRIVYAGHLYEDDGLWFTAAEEIVRGKALYREIYFDKPPGLALTYALLFWIFGAHILTVRLFTIVYSVAISAVLYLFGSWLYDKRIGLLAAAMFAVFSTTYATGHIQSLSTDLLMALPYTAGAYLLVRSRWQRRHQTWLAAAGGAVTGLAFQTNPKGIFGLIFFALSLIASSKLLAVDKLVRGTAEDQPENRPSSLRLLGVSVVGFAICSLPFLAYLIATRSLREYLIYVWDWGARYSAFHGPLKIVASAVTRSADYFALNNTLLITLVFIAFVTIRRAGRGTKQAPGAGSTSHAFYSADAMLLIWFAVSYAGVMIGGRFYAHYFIQILPALCLIAARGLAEIPAWLVPRTRGFRRTATAIIIVGFVFTLVRFHGRGVLLAADFVRGTVSESNKLWYHGLRDREERMVAAVVRDIPDGADAAERLGLEAIRAGGPRTRQPNGAADYVFVWGYRPEIYFWSGLLPASRFLSSQPLTGVPADIHYFTDEYRSLLDENVTARARAQLVQDLEATQPKYIVDEIGFFNGDLAILNYPELQEVMSKYKYIGPTGRFLIYIRRE